MSFFGIFWKAEIYINSENKKKKETGVIKMIRTKLSRTLKESPFELYSLQINREISTKIFSYIPFEPKKIYEIILLSLIQCRGIIKKCSFAV